MQNKSILDKKTFTLTELCESVQSVLHRTYKNNFWIKAEIVKLNYYPKSGHCYPDLVHKKDGKVLSQLRGFILGRDYQKIQKNFKEKGSIDLKSGMKVLMLAKVQFHPTHGISLLIQDIDPNFTFGEMALNRLASINKLKAEGIFTKNKEKPFPLIPNRIAVISVKTSKGFQDFMNIIESNEQNINIEINLFTALLQGDAAVQSIIKQLDKIAERASYFDAVCIIRGGGGEIGLDCYDAYSLSKKIANFPLPILSGIGHVSNRTVTEQVSFKNFITPTELGFFILNKFIKQIDYLKELKENLNKETFEFLKAKKENIKLFSKLCTDSTKLRLEKEKNKINSVKYKLSSIGQRSILEKKSEHLTLDKKMKFIVNNYMNLHVKEPLNCKIKLEKNLEFYIYKKKQEFKNKQQKIAFLNPLNLLKKGYSISTINGSIIKDVNQLKKGDTIETIFNEGSIKAQITTIKNGKKEV